jgi:hypothetical protein
MTPESDLQIAYLLGRLKDAERMAVEERLFSDEAFFDSLEIAEDRLIQAYVRGELTSDEREGFKRHFDQSPQRRERVEIAIALEQHFARPAEATQTSTSRRSFATFVRGLGTSRRLTKVGCAAAICFAVLSGWLAVRLRREQRILAEERRLAAARIDKSARVGETGKGSRPQPSAAKWSHDEEQSQLRIPDFLFAQSRLPPAPRREGLEGILNIPGEPKNVEIMLESKTELSPGKYYVSLESEPLVAIWGRDVLVNAGKKPSVYLRVQVPADFLRAGRYVLTLYAYTKPGVREVIVDYTFRVVR